MRDTGYGRIDTIGSKAVVRPMAEMAAYTAAKARVVALGQVLAAETQGARITANCVLPSVIDAAANRAAMGDAAAEKWVSPASLAETIVYLASTAAGVLRGAAIPVYGDV
jgi:NAD(P)-dependent dehydrogenase (short-subunit alcohol dehydrogenase family)